MSVSVFDHPWLSALFDAPQITPLWSAEAQMAHLVAYETAWTKALAQTGRISAEVGREALAALDGWQPDWQGLRAGVAVDGIVIPALVRQMRAGLRHPAAIHTGATSQDVMDTALALTLNRVTAVLCAELRALCALCDELIARFGEAPLMGRTRMQAALPITAGHRLHGWRAGLAGALARGGDQGMPLQIGGAVGDGQALGADADAIADCLASLLDTPRPAQSWHTDRASIIGYGAWLVQVTGALGKMGQDICLMAQQGIGEIALSSGGGSSAMPHKTNPVQAELLVTLARYTAGQSGGLGQALIHEQERSGSAWALEWMLLPPMTAATGTATHTAHALLSGITRIGDV